MHNLELLGAHLSVTVLQLKIAAPLRLPRCSFMTTLYSNRSVSQQYYHSEPDNRFSGEAVLCVLGCLAASWPLFIGRQEQ